MSDRPGNTDLEKTEAALAAAMGAVSDAMFYFGRTFSTDLRLKIPQYNRFDAILRSIDAERKIVMDACVVERAERNLVDANQ